MDPLQAWRLWRKAWAVADVGLPERVAGSGAAEGASAAKPQGAPALRRALTTAASLAAALALGLLSLRTQEVAADPGDSGGLASAIRHACGGWRAFAALAALLALGPLLPWARLRCAAEAAGLRVRPWRGSLLAAPPAGARGGREGGAAKEPLLQHGHDAGSAARESVSKPEGAVGDALGSRQVERGRTLGGKRRGGATSQKTARMLEKTRKLIDAWIAALSLGGVGAAVNGQDSRVRLKDPGFDTLTLGSEEVPLVDLALHLDGKVLVLVASSHASDGSPRRFRVELDDPDAALELALTLKVLRGAADTGGGVLAWSSRTSDRFTWPLPAE